MIKKNCNQAPSCSLLGVKGGRGGSCDVRKGYQGNPDCKSSESCVPEILNLGECKTGNISWQWMLFSTSFVCDDTHELQWYETKSLQSIIF